jgi:hypothetical protein
LYINNIIDIVFVLNMGQGFCHFLIGHADWWREGHMLSQWALPINTSYCYGENTRP